MERAGYIIAGMFMFGKDYIIHNYVYGWYRLRNTHVVVFMEGADYIIHTYVYGWDRLRNTHVFFYGRGRLHNTHVCLWLGQTT